MVRRLLALVAFVPALFAQNSSTVEGRIIDSVTGAGIEGVRVTLRGDRRVVNQAATDAQGAFRMAAMPDGRYTVAYTKNLFSHENGAPDPALVVSGNTHFEARLTAWVSVSGRVTDPQGQPTPGVHVELSSNHTAVTDQEGAFTILAVAPGSYKVLAKPGANPVKNGEAIIPTYFPSSPEIARAEAIAVRGLDIAGYEIRLVSAAVHRVHGVVFDPDGKPLPKAVVALFKPASGQITQMRGASAGLRMPQSPAEAGRTESGDDGAFEFAAVPEGEWMIRAQENGRDAQSYAIQALTVSRREGQALELRLLKPFAMVLAVEPADRKLPQAILSPLDGQPMRADSMQMAGLFAGRYYFSEGPVPTPGYYLSAVMLDGRDVLGRVVELNSPGKFTAVYRNDGGSVSGTVEKGASSVVALVRRQEAGRERMMQTVRCDAQGGFTARDVAPGDYDVVALADPRAAADAEFGSVLASSGKRVHVDAGSSTQIDLQIAPAGPQ